MKVLGIDYGAKKIGIALSDDEQRIALTHGVVFFESFGQFIAELQRIVAEEEIERVVIGVPRNDSRQKREIEDFIASVGTNIRVPVETEDESLTTVMAQKLTRGVRKRNEPEDAVAAQIILQSYLDRRRRRAIFREA